MRNLLCIIFLCGFSLSYGQFVEPKFGQIEISDLAMTRYDKDTSANALMLFDNGNSRFDLNSDRKFQFIYTRHCRIKIFKKAAFPFADFNIRLYKSGSSKETLLELKAATFNLVNGKVIRTKLDNGNIYNAEGKNYTDKKFAFPEVKEGSIIELSYSIISDFLYNFRSWNFQYNFPAIWSQYKCIIPEYFNYRQSTKGYLAFDLDKKIPGTITFRIHYDPEISLGKQGEFKSAENYDLKANTLETTLATKDVPAFISEPNIDCEDNYIQCIEFELNSIQYPNDMLRDYTQTWESVNKKMNDDEDFGILLKSSGFISDTVAYICNNKSSEIGKAINIYNYVQKRIKWNGDYSLWALKGLKKPFTDRTGNSSEINLLLILMLQTAGLKANPVIFSTRNNGNANTFYPTISKFNSVLTRVEIDGKIYLLDPISKYCPFGILPANDINGRGRVVNNLNGDWANLEAKEKYTEVKSYALEISNEGKFTGSISESYDGYAGIVYRNYLSSEKSNDDYIRKLQENIKGLTIKNYSIADRFNIYKPLSDTLNVEIMDHAEIIGDKILFNPLLFEAIEKNRYTLEDRKYPVDYNYPILETYVFEYTLPAGYKVESLPQSLLLKLPNNSISITYNLQSIDNKIKVIYQRNIDKILFIPAEYKNLKELYDQMVKKHAEQVILKKII